MFRFECDNVGLSIVLVLVILNVFGIYIRYGNKEHFIWWQKKYTLQFATAVAVVIVFNVVVELFLFRMILLHLSSTNHSFRSQTWREEEQKHTQMGIFFFLINLKLAGKISKTIHTFTLLNTISFSTFVYWILHTLSATNGNAWIDSKGFSVVLLCIF